MRIVTTCAKAGFKQYGKKTLEGLNYWPKDAEIYWYSEGFTLPKGRATAKRTEDLPKLAEFKAKWQHYQAPDWRFDVVRFANKVYAVHDALRDYKGLGIWMDADIQASRSISGAYLKSLLPYGCYIALFQRKGRHSETGLWLVDCNHPAHQSFMDTLLAWYESGRFQEAHEWHDCIYMDSTIRAFEKRQLIEAHNLSVDPAYAHPMAVHPIARYLDHLKGPVRKALGHSPERKAP